MRPAAISTYRVKRNSVGKRSMVFGFEDIFTGDFAARVLGKQRFMLIGETF